MTLANNCREKWLEVLSLHKLAVVRRTGFRPFDINFFEQIQDLDVKLIHAGPDLKTSLKSVKLETQPLFPLDPSSFLKSKDSLMNLASWAYLTKLDREIKACDAINTIEPYFFVTRQCCELAKKFDKPLVVSVAQNLRNHPSRFAPPYCWNTKKTVETADLFIAMTARAKSYLLALGVKEGKIKVIYPGVDVNKFCSAPKTNERIPRVLFVGNLYVSKGLLELLEADVQLHKDGIDHELWICGRGNLSALVEQYSKKYRVKHLGFVPNDKMPHIYQQSDIFCLPSRDYRVGPIKIGEEQFGFVFLEAMASGLPVVTSNSGSIPEAVGSQNILVEKGSVKALYDALKVLLVDKKMRVSIGEKNRNRVENFFDIKKQSAIYEKEIIDLINKQRYKKP
jgi:glycosyltransferase involved in cell wall biosynthesis